MPGTAVITGASTGIGKSLALQLSDEGYNVVIVARSNDKLKSIAEKIKVKGGSCLPVALDISKPENIKILKKNALDFGDISVVVNNAGMGKFSKIEDVILEDWNVQMDLNLRAAFFVSQAFIPQMKEKQKGTLVFINSVAGKMGYAYSAAYVASKYGLKGLADSMREELRGDNIKVISIHPGAVDTPFWDTIHSDFKREEMLNSVSLAQSIVQTINAPGNLTVEEMVVRRVKGDF